MSYNLFLDDVRQPHEVGNYFNPVEFRKLFRLSEWIIVRSYSEFIKKIEESGMPQMISFDHDLADEHYRPSMYNPDRHYSNYYTDGTFKEKTGYDCAKWLVEYARTKNEKLPMFLCHSMNPTGRENILTLLHSVKNAQGSDTSEAKR